MSTDRIARHDVDDRLMVSLARLAFDVVIPTEDSGGHAVARVEKDVKLVRQLFEKAIGNFYAAELRALGWTVRQGKRLEWQKETASPGIDAILPGMTMDIILEDSLQARRLIIDTKFTSVFGASPHRAAVLKRALTSIKCMRLFEAKNRRTTRSFSASGMLLYPSVDVDETVRMHGHQLRFATVNLTMTATRIIERLREIILT